MKAKIFYYNSLINYFTVKINIALHKKDFNKVEHFLEKKKKIAPKLRKLVHLSLHK